MLPAVTLPKCKYDFFMPHFPIQKSHWEPLIVLQRLSKEETARFAFVIFRGNNGTTSFDDENASKRAQKSLSWSI